MRKTVKCGASLLLVSLLFVCCPSVQAFTLNPPTHGQYPNSARSTRSGRPTRLSHLRAKQDAQVETVISEKMQNQAPNTQAELGFSFSVAGLFFSYHLGVAEVLREEGLITDNTPLAGASGGALAAVAIALGLDGRKVVERTEQMCTEIRQEGQTTKGRLAQLVRPVIDEILPQDAHLRLNEYPGGLSLGVLALKPLPSAESITSFTSRDDLIDVMLASSHFPFWLSPWPLTRCRWYLCMDGFFARRSEFGCPPTPAAATVCVSPFLEGQVFKRKASQGGGEDVAGYGDGVISPQLQMAEGRGQLEEMLPVALDPSPDDTLLLRNFDDGRRDARVWVEQWRGR